MNFAVGNDTVYDHPPQKNTFLSHTHPKKPTPGRHNNNNNNKRKRKKFKGLGTEKKKRGIMSTYSYKGMRTVQLPSLKNTPHVDIAKHSKN